MEEQWYKDKVKEQEAGMDEAEKRIAEPQTSPTTSTATSTSLSTTSTPARQPSPQQQQPQAQQGKTSA
jgi:hypothetical protein